MANTATPYGLMPVNLIGGQPFAGSTRMFPIVTNYGTNIFFGDVVKAANTGYIEKDTGTTTLTPVGVFMGCSYMDPTYGLTFRQRYTANTVPANSQDTIAYVCDDPDTVFRIQASASMTQTMLFNNAGVVQGAGSTVTGKSAVSLDASTAATTDSLPLRIVGWWGGNLEPGIAAGSAQECIVPTDDYPDVLVKWNFGMQRYQVALGI